MGVYSIVLALSLIFAFWNLLKNKDRSRTLLIILFSILFLISAIRVNVGADYAHMRDDIFYKIGGNFANGTYVEHGYGLLNAFLYNVSFGHYHSLLLLSALLYSSVFFLLIRRFVDKKWQLYSGFLYIGTGIFFATLNLTRQYWAISLVILAFIMFMKFKDTSRLKAALIPLALIALASVFHLSSLISLLFVPFYLIAKSKHARLFFGIAIATSVLFMFIDIRTVVTALSSILPSRWQWYTESRFLNYRNFSSIVKQIPIILMAGYSIMYFKELKQYKYFTPAISLFIVNTIITNIAFGIMVLVRLSYYFDFSILLLLPIILAHIREKFGKRLFIIGTVLSTSYYVSLTIVTIFIMNGQGVMPYNSLIGGF